MFVNNLIIIVTQAGTPTTPILTVSPTTMELPAQKSSKFVQVTSNVFWSATTAASWLTLVNSPPVAPPTDPPIYPPIIDYSTSDIMNFIDSETTTSLGSEITVSPDFVIENNQISGTGDRAFSINAEANTGTSARNAAVTVSGGGITRTISVAQAAVTTYTVTYNANGGKGTAPSSQPVTAGKGVYLQKNTFTKSGYSFRGWSTSSTAIPTMSSIEQTAMYSIEQEAEIYSPEEYVTPVGNMPLYAVWDTPGSSGYTVYSPNGVVSTTLSSVLEAVSYSSSNPGSYVKDNKNQVTVYERSDSSSVKYYMFQQDQPYYWKSYPSKCNWETSPDNVNWHMRNLYYLHVFKSDGAVYGNGAYYYGGNSTQKQVAPGDIVGIEPRESYVYKFSKGGYNRMTATIPLDDVRLKINDDNTCYIYAQIADFGVESNYVEIGICHDPNVGWQVFRKSYDKGFSTALAPNGNKKVVAITTLTNGEYTTNLNHSLNLDWRHEKNANGIWYFKFFVDGTLMYEYDMNGELTNPRILAATTFCSTSPNIPNYSNGNYMENVVWQNCKVYSKNGTSYDFKYDDSTIHRAIVHNDDLVKMSPPGTGERIDIRWEPGFGTH